MDAQETTPMNEREWYDLHCKQEFADLKESLLVQAKTSNQILGLLRGANGARGLCEQIREMEKSMTTVAKTVSSHDTVLHGNPEDLDDQGIVGKVHSHHKIIKYIIGCVGLVVATILGQVGKWLIKALTG